MAFDDIRAEIRATFLSADQMWGLQSPFNPNSIWIGYLANEVQTAHVEATLGTGPAELRPGDAKYDDVRQFILDILPAPGRALFLTGYDAMIEVSPCDSGWTPSTFTCALVTDPDNGEKYTEICCCCGGKPTP